MSEKAVPLFGLLNLGKPAGITSRDAVNQVQRLVRPAKVGHAGTLDPLATGVLMLCIGPATRLIRYVQQMRKKYRGTFLLGRRSETEDIEGDVEFLPGAPQPTRREFEAILPGFVGQITQRPPQFSALMVKGRRAYALARQGQPIDLQLRTVTVYGLQIVAYAYPELTLEIECGSGTYVRALGRDIAQALNTECVMSGLVRTAIGPFALEKSLSLDDLTKQAIASHLLAPLEALGDLPHVTLTTAEHSLISRGQTIANRFEVSSEEIAATSVDGKLLAILKPRGSDHWGPARNFDTSMD